MNKAKKIRTAANLSMAEEVEILKPHYPRISKTALSLAENTRLTGVMLSPQATKTLCDLIKSPVIENRKRPCRLSFRVTNEFAQVFNTAKEEAGYVSTDGFLFFIVNEYIEKRKALAAEANKDLSQHTT